MKRLVIRHKGCGCLFLKPGMGTTMKIERAEGYTAEEAATFIAAEREPHRWEAITITEARRKQKRVTKCPAADV